MAVVYQYSSLLTDGAQDGSGNTTPNQQFKAPAGLSHARMRLKYGTCYVPLDDESAGADLLSLAMFGKSDRIFRIDVGTSADLSSGNLDLEFGIYEVDTDGTIGSLVGNANSIADIDAAGQLTFGSADHTASAARGVELWSVAGLSTAPSGGNYIIAATNEDADVTTAGTLTFQFQYTSGD